VPLCRSFFCSREREDVEYLELVRDGWSQTWVGTLSSDLRLANICESTHRRLHHPKSRIQVYLRYLRPHIRRHRPMHVLLRPRNRLLRQRTRNRSHLRQKHSPNLRDSHARAEKDIQTTTHSLPRPRIERWLLANELQTNPAHHIPRRHLRSFHIQYLRRRPDTHRASTRHNFLRPTLQPLLLSDRPHQPTPVRCRLGGNLTAGYTANFTIQWMTKHNNGVYEPEFRLVLMTVAATLSTVAYVGFGFSVAWGATLYIPMLSWDSDVAMLTYVMGCHPSHAAQALVTLFIKALLSLVISNFVNSWFQQSGAKVVFITVAIINLGVSTISIPMYIFGKRLRAMIETSGFHQKI
jgi:hypothetical protein